MDGSKKQHKDKVEKRLKTCAYSVAWPLGSQRLSSAPLQPHPGARVYLVNPVGIGEHPDVLGAIQDQIDLIAKEEERLEVIEKYFEDK